MDTEVDTQLLDFVPNQNQTFIAKRDWDNLRPYQRRVLLEMELDDEILDNTSIHDTIDFVTFRTFDELSPEMKKTITYMIGGFE